jgi:hypothetical protein
METVDWTEFQLNAGKNMTGMLRRAFGRWQANYRSGEGKME